MVFYSGYKINHFYYLEYITDMFLMINVILLSIILIWTIEFLYVLWNWQQRTCVRGTWTDNETSFKVIENTDSSRIDEKLLKKKEGNYYNFNSMS